MRSCGEVLGNVLGGCARGISVDMGCAAGPFSAGLADAATGVVRAPGSTGSAALGVASDAVARIMGSACTRGGTEAVCIGAGTAITAVPVLPSWLRQKIARP